MKRIKYVIIVVILIMLFAYVNKLDDDFMESCTDAGYSRLYCESQK